MDVPPAMHSLENLSHFPKPTLQRLDWGVKYVILSRRPFSSIDLPFPRLYRVLIESKHSKGGSAWSSDSECPVEGRWRPWITS